MSNNSLTNGNTNQSTPAASGTKNVKPVYVVKKRSFPRTNDFYYDLAMRESNNVVNVQNRLGYIGLYQMGEASLADAGYYVKTKKTGKKLYNHDWKGTWTGKNGVVSKEYFLSSREAQTRAIREYHKMIWESYLKDYKQYDGHTIGGILFTKSGMIAASHLVGAGSVKELIRSGGKINKSDANRVTALDYLLQFNGYQLDFSDL